MGNHESTPQPNPDIRIGDNLIKVLAKKMLEQEELQPKRRRGKSAPKPTVETTFIDSHNSDSFESRNVPPPENTTIHEPLLNDGFVGVDSAPKSLQPTFPEPELPSDMLQRFEDTETQLQNTFEEVVSRFTSFNTVWSRFLADHDLSKASKRPDPKGFCEKEQERALECLLTEQTRGRKTCEELVRAFEECSAKRSTS